MAKSPGKPRERFGGFPTTNWSHIFRAGNEQAGGGQALTEFLQGYLPALRAYLVVTRQMDAHDAEDLLQNFVIDKVIRDKLLGRAEQGRGKFRTFLLGVLNNYLVSQIRHDRAKRRAPGQPLVPLEEANHVADGDDPTHGFEIAWARQVVARALDGMKQECLRTGRANIWGVFEGRVLYPTLYEQPPASYENLIIKFAFRTPSEAANTLTTGKRMFTRHLKEVVGEYAESESEIEGEIADLRLILSRISA